MEVMYLAFEGLIANGTNHLALTMIDEFLSSGIKTYLVTSHSLGLYEDIPALLKDRDGFSMRYYKAPCCFNRTSRDTGTV